MSSYLTFLWNFQYWNKNSLFLKSAILDILLQAESWLTTQQERNEYTNALCHFVAISILRVSRHNQAVAGAVLSRFFMVVLPLYYIAVL